MGRSITCDNHDGSKMTFSMNRFSPFVLANVDGLYLSDNNVSISDNTMIDGGTYQGSVKKKRNIVLTLLDRPDNPYNQRNRDALYILFNEGNLGTLTYEENGETRQIDYYVEKIYKKNISKHTITVSLIAADPFFYDTEPTNVSMADWDAGFEFDHEFLDEGEEIETRSAVKLINIVNDTATNNIGMTITLRSASTVVNPKITRVESDTHIQIGSENYPFTMQADDKIVITTGLNNKHVYLIRGGVQTEVNEYLTEDSKFIQLMRGNNNIGYSAESGEDYLSVEVSYKMKYSGA